MSKITVSKSKLLKAAQRLPDVKNIMEHLIPEIFEGEYFNFGEQYTIDTSTKFPPIPLYIGHYTVTKKDKHKVLIVCSRYEIEVIPNYYKGNTGLKFKRKK